MANWIESGPGEPRPYLQVCRGQFSEPRCEETAALAKMNQQTRNVASNQRHPFSSGRNHRQETVDGGPYTVGGKGWLG